MGCGDRDVSVTVKKDLSNLIRTEIYSDSTDEYNLNNQYTYIMYSRLFCIFLDDSNLKWFREY